MDIEARCNVVRGLHIQAVIAWMAGMLYLPRLYVYHTKAVPGGELDETLKVMELKLLKIIINPAMMLALGFGLILIYMDATYIRGWGLLLKTWMLTKIVGVLFLGAWHGYLAAARRRFETGTNQRSERYWRMTNELPFLAAIVIVMSVTTKFLD